MNPPVPSDYAVNGKVSPSTQVERPSYTEAIRSKPRPRKGTGYYNISSILFSKT